MRLVGAATGGRLTKQFVDVVLSGDGSRAELIGLMFGDQGQQFDSYTLQDHLGDREDDPVLGVVLVVDGRLRHADRVRDHLERGPADAVLGEQLERGPDDPALGDGRRDGADPHFARLADRLA